MFPNSKPPDEDALEGYTKRLCHIPAPVIRAAGEQCIAELKWFPTVAEIRERAEAVTATREPLPGDLYGDTVRELSVALVEQRVADLAPAVWEVVKGLGGPWALVYSKNPETTRAHFLKAIEGKMRQERTLESIVPAARLHVPGPSARQIGFAPSARQLPAGAEAPVAPPGPVSREDAAALLAEINRRSMPSKLPRHPASAAAMRRAIDVVAAAGDAEEPDADTEKETL